MSEMLRWDGAQLQLDQLDELAKTLAARTPVGSARFNFLMNAAVIRFFLGDAWFAKHAMLDAHPQSYLRPNFTSDTGVDPRYSILILELAELLLNLQVIGGFAKRLEHLNLTQFESGLAELRFGQCLKERGVPFKFTEDQDATTADIIFEAPDGSQALCEIKCKTDSTPFSRNTLQNAFSEASRQIGQGNPGIVAIKAPSAWMEIDQAHASERPIIRIPREVAMQVKDLLRQSRRIRKAVFFVAHDAYAADWGLSATRTNMEFDNPRNAPPWDVELLNAYPSGTWISILELGRRWAARA